MSLSPTSGAMMSEKVWQSLVGNYQKKRKAEMIKSDVYREYYSTYHGLELKPDVNLPYMRTTTENGILYYAEFLMLLHMRGELDGLDKARFYKLVKDLQVEPGLYDRGAGESKNIPYEERRSISHDNMDAISAASVLCDYEFQNDIVNYGLSNYGMYNNIAPRKVMPVNPGNFSMWLHSAGKTTLSVALMPFLLANMAVNYFKSNDNVSGRKLYLLELYAITQKKNNFLFSFIAKMYFKTLVSKYGQNFVHAIYSIYYPVGHPLVEFSRNIKYVNGKFEIE